MTPAAPALVLSGGNALGAYHLGACQALEAAGVEPGWVAGSSIGAVMAGIIAGNAPGERGAALARFWDAVAAFDGAAALLPALLRQPLQYAQALSARSLGHPPLFTLRPPDLAGADPRPGLYDLTPMRQLLAGLIDLDRLNGGALRLSVLAVDLASGQEVVFDTRRERIGLDHLMASAALIPNFPPIEINGRLLVDGGLSANLPVHLVLEETLSSARTTCFAVDLFPLAAPLPHGLLQAMQRQNDLLYASQTTRAFHHLRRIWHGREPGADLFHLAYGAEANETALKGFDFAAGSLAMRKAAGERDMRAQLATWQAGAGSGPGLSIHPPQYDCAS